MSSSSLKSKLNPSHITVLKASCREFDHKEKMNVYDRKLANEYSEMERKLQKSQKWASRVEKNIILKSIYNKRITDLEGLVEDGLTPSVDEWLQMNSKKRNAKTSLSVKVTKPKHSI